MHLNNFPVQGAFSEILADSRELASAPPERTIEKPESEFLDIFQRPTESFFFEKYAFQIPFQYSEDIPDGRIIQDYDRIDTVLHGLQNRNTASFYDPILLCHSGNLASSVILAFHQSRLPLELIQVDDRNVVMSSEPGCESRFPGSSGSDDIDAHKFFITKYFKTRSATPASSRTLIFSRRAPHDSLARQ